MNKFDSKCEIVWF